MRLVRFGPRGEERPGVWIPGAEGEPATILDVRAMAFDINDYDAHFFSHGGLQRLAALLRESGRKTVSTDGVRLGPPLARPAKVICVGTNYPDHAAEFGVQMPDTPTFFSKGTNAWNGPFDPIVLPAGARVVDAEVELALVMGERVRGVSEAGALSSVAGFTVLNDVTDREAQRAGRQWFRGKSADTFCPVGPFVVTRDEVEDPLALELYSKINDREVQRGNTASMFFRPGALVAALSATLTLEPGDVLATGTPAGVGSAREPPVLLAPGDTVEVGVQGVGVQINPVVPERP